MNVLVTGSDGQLGSELRSLSVNYSQMNFFFTDVEVLDIVNYSALENYVHTHKIQVIINCAAYTNVDGAEDEVDLANVINVEAVRNLGEISKKNQIKLIHISTDYVFDGNLSVPYKETDVTNPQNVYGTTKLKGEEVLLKIDLKNSIIIRTAWLYSSFGKNFVKTILKLSTEKEELSVVNDQMGSPTYAADLANAILKIIPFIKNDAIQTYHYSNKGMCSWFDFANEIVLISKRGCKVLPVSSEQFKSKAKRPNFSMLATEKIEQEFHLNIPDWKKSLNECIKKIKL